MIIDGIDDLPNIATMLMRFMARLNGRSASPRITAT
jgi:hypothetical protein